MRNLLLVVILIHIVSNSNAFFGFASYWSNIINRIYFARTNAEATRRQSNNVAEEYDFIVVGSGSAGAVIASRLSENPNWNVLLLEAGGHANAFSEIPIFAPILQLTPFNWGYTMEKQDGFCNAMEEEICAWPRGKALGGTSVINYMIYTRGNPIDFQKWKSQGNKGWSYKDVLPYYLKSENCNLGDECYTKYHSTGGYLNIEYPFTSKLTDSFIRAGVEMGHRMVDYSTPKYMGFSKIQATLKHGRRHSVNTAFLEPFYNRTNLHIVSFARVKKVLIDPVTKIAHGVEYYKSNHKFTATVIKEVILSAGTFHSPQLLMLSGIGPQQHLEELGIPVLQNLPVGETLYDHIAYLGAIFTINETVLYPQQMFDPNEMLNWVSYGKGFYSSLGGIEGIAYINTDKSKEKNNYPDIELLLAAIGSLQWDNGIFSRKLLRVKQSVYDEYFKPLENKNCFSIMPMLLHPKSKGYLRLKSSDPLDAPLLYGNYFSDKEHKDLRTMLSALRFIQKLAKQEAFQKYNAQLYDKTVPGCENFIFDSDEYWMCAFGSLTVTLHHQIATCKMGSNTDPEAVVDNKLRVHGITGLRVADSSVIPVTLSAHTNAPSIMIGERLSDILKEYWKNRTKEYDIEPRFG